MSAGAVAFAMLAILLFAAAAPLRVAYRERRLFATDLLLPVLPAAGFVAGLLGFNAPAQVGWALIVYPFLVVAASVSMLYVSVYGLRKLFIQVRTLSLGVLSGALVVAMLLGATVAPWYE
ncbi:hypothetical protein [Lysobacter panacisoli]|uniref:Uncharacterized protein n=1 Tax=Lysobacter panacisoli TaxID=1255263 RepID=A0ABP9L2B4_9GAMM|nr:hypothetical protein [Lysobacter panacisoli]